MILLYFFWSREAETEVRMDYFESTFLILLLASMISFITKNLRVIIDRRDNRLYKWLMTTH